jgi:hypothetical protein
MRLNFKMVQKVGWVERSDTHHQSLPHAPILAYFFSLRSSVKVERITIAEVSVCGGR